MTETAISLSKWRRRYIKACIDELCPKGDMLVIGFETATAEALKKYTLASHTIIESDAKSLQKARRFASKHANVTVIEDSPEKALLGLKTFDTIFLNDTRPPPSSKRVHQKQPSSFGVVKKLHNQLEEQFMSIKVQFSDQQIDDFYQTVGKSNLDAVPEFLLKLVENGNISQEQYENALKKYNIEPQRKEPDVQPEDFTDTLSSVLMQCIHHNMHKGSRFSCFLKGTASWYEDLHFFQDVIADPILDYREKVISITVPDVCEHDARIMVVEKLV